MQEIKGHYFQGLTLVAADSTLDPVKLSDSIAPLPVILV